MLDGLGGAVNTDWLGGLKKTYCYVAWNGSSVEGSIYAGDVQRDASNNVIADDKGGFIVDGQGSDFYAGSAIELLPGFKTESGTVFSAQIVDKPCGYSSNNLTGEQQQEDVAYLKTTTGTGKSNLKQGEVKAFPNPFGDFLNVSYDIIKDTPLSIELVNTLGQVVWQKNFGTQLKGEFQTTIQTNDLPKGFYTILFKAEGITKSLKLVH